MASRYYYYSSATSYYWQGRVVSGSGQEYNNDTNLYSYGSSKFSAASSFKSLRPIVTLKSTLTYSGLGTMDSPMEIQ